METALYGPAPAFAGHTAGGLRAEAA